MLSKQWKAFFIISLAVLVLAIIMAAWGFPKLVQNKLQQNLQLSEDSPMFAKWQKLPIPIKFEVYLFNVTNPEDVSEGAKPVLQQVGPFVYDEYREKTILSYGENDTITYMLQKKFYYNANETQRNGNSEDQELTVIHFPYLAAILTVHDSVPVMASMINGALMELFSNITDPFLRVNVKDLLFDGIYLTCVGENKALVLVCSKIKSETPPTMRPAEDGNGYYFSMFNHMNSTPMGPFTVKRGTENIFNMGTIVGYKNRTDVKTWNDKYCNMINGSDGATNPPIEKETIPKRLYSFQPDLCRSVYVAFDKKSSDDLKSYVYKVDETVLASKSAVPPNKCFCKKNWSFNHDGCLMMGVMSLMACQGAPVIVSWPHFYMASEELLEYFAGGIQPSAEAHGSYMKINPTTGVMIEGAQRIQFNVELRNIKGIPQLETVKTGLFPLLWVNEGASMTAEIEDELMASQRMLNYVQIFRWAFLAAAVVLLFVSAYLLAKHTSLKFFSRNSNSVTFMMK